MESRQSKPEAGLCDDQWSFWVSGCGRRPRDPRPAGRRLFRRRHSRKTHKLCPALFLSSLGSRTWLPGSVKPDDEIATASPRPKAFSHA